MRFHDSCSQVSLRSSWVSARPLAESPSEVELTVAWELSWYRYRVDLADADDPVTLRDKGEELEQLEESVREWNATASASKRFQPASCDVLRASPTSTGRSSRIVISGCRSAVAKDITAASACISRPRPSP